MSITANQLITQAKKLNGYKATATSCIPNNWFYGRNVGGGTAWCAATICYWFHQLGADNLIPVKSAGCGVLARGFYDKGQIVTSGYKAGDIAFFHWSNTMSSSVPGVYTLDHVGLIICKNADGSYTTIEGNTGNSTYGECKTQVRYANQISCCARPNYATENTQSNTTSNSKSFPNVTYRVRTGGHWLPAVKNWNEYAGIIGKSITDLAIKVSEGSVKYRVHIKGGNWLPYVTGYDTNNHNNGYAGNGKIIDAIDIYYTTPSSVKNRLGKPLKAKYHVSPVGCNYYSNQYDNERINGQDGYAGAFGKSIDRVQITLAY